MRAGPLSNEKVIALLNRSFVPVYAVNEDYRKDGPAPPEERAEYDRIYRASLEAKLSTGTVHVYIVAPDGRPIDSLHVAEAAKTEKLIELLERSIARLKPPAGAPLAAPRPQSSPPSAAPGALVLHLSARREGRGSWGEFPSEDWIVVPEAECAKLLPPAGAPAGASYAIDRAVVARLLTRFYPQTENNDVSTNRLDEASLTGSVERPAGSPPRVRLEGKLRMKHTFYPHREDDRFVEATLSGLLELDHDSGRVRSLKLVTAEARYGKEPFVAALESIP